MTVFCVSYDLKKPGRDYVDLYKKLNAYKCVHVLESTWFIVTDEEVGKVRDNLMSIVDANDLIIVIEVVKHWGTFNIKKEDTDFLKNVF